MSVPITAPRRLAPILTALLLLTLGCQTRPAPEATARAYVDAWQRSDYAAMFALVSASSQGKTAGGAFALDYRVVAEIAGLQSLVVTLGARAPGSDDRQARFPVSVRWQTTRFGTFA